MRTLRIPLHTSRLAIWARRLAGFALPLAVIPVFMHRQMLISSPVFTLIFAVAILLAIGAVVLSLAAFVRLWNTGDRGWGRSVQALILGLAISAPPIAFEIAGARFPAANDVSTPGSSLKLAFVQNPEARPLPSTEVSRAFPYAAGRTYTLPPQTTFELALMLVKRNGWDIRTSTEPGDSNSPGRIDAIAMTWLGWRDEVVISISGSGENADVAMRSASFFGNADLGVNGRRIETFLLALDAVAGDTPRPPPPGLAGG